MGTTNQPSDFFSRLRALERRVDEFFKKVGLTSAVIDRGGLTLKNDAFLRMVDDLGVEILYFGPDDQGRQIIRIRREGGSDVFWTGFTVGGNPFWRLTDRISNRELFSDDTENGGIARPWLSVPLYPQFSMAASSVYAYRTVAVSAVTSETTLWQGRIPLVTHPFMSVGGIFGQASGSNTSTYRLKLGTGPTTVGTWAETALVNTNKGPYDVTAFLGQTDVPIILTATASGTGSVGCQVYSAYLRQT